MTKTYLIPLTLLCSLFIASGLSAQSEGMTEALDGIKGAYKAKDTNDKVHFTNLIVERWSEADDKQRKSAQGYMKKGLKSRAAEVREASVDALAKMTGGKKDKWSVASTRLLIPEIKKKTTEGNIAYFSRVLLAIGDIAHPKGVAPLTKLLKYKNYDIVAVSADSLGKFRNADIKVKKDIVSEILKIYMSLEGQARDPRNNVAKDRLQKIKRPCDNALKALTGQSFTSAGEWQSWWNKVGKKAKSWA